jgi:xanthine dehydrogenase accessory factor
VTTWFEAVAALRAAREAGVLVTVTDVRGHAPREAGAKMVVSAPATWAPSAAATSRRRPYAARRELLDSGDGRAESFTATSRTRRRSSTACSAAAAR